jgi:hypothetical protein
LMRSRQPFLNRALPLAHSTRRPSLPHRRPTRPPLAASFAWVSCGSLLVAVRARLTSVWCSVRGAAASLQRCG